MSDSMIERQPPDETWISTATPPQQGMLVEAYWDCLTKFPRVSPYGRAKIRRGEWCNEHGLGLVIIPAFWRPIEMPNETTSG